jgi:hypothetical protein
MTVDDLGRIVVREASGDAAAPRVADVVTIRRGAG